tara:strand:- start:600 stop:734 length:135 start_codon:yes stop_codon:yes gene_type:complete
LKIGFLKSDKKTKNEKIKITGDNKTKKKKEKNISNNLFTIITIY